MDENVIITVRVDFVKGTVSWEWEGVIRDTAENPLLLDKEIRWTPYVQISRHSMATIVG